jgi:spore photoproduct lyase
MNATLREFIYRDTLVPALEAEDQSFLLALATQYDLEFTDIQTLANAARDLEMWRETPLASLWAEWELEEMEDSRPSKQSLLSRLEGHMNQLRVQEKTYPTEPLRGLRRASPQLVERPAPTKVFTSCPYFSAEANCCGLNIIEAVTGCALGCSFCNVNASMGETVEFSTDLAERLSQVELDSDRFYHVSTSHMSDSLVWGNRHGMLDALFDFARRHPNVQLELKTKSDRIDYLLRHEIPRNVVCSWWLSPDTIIRNEEHGTSTLRGRFQAARRLRDRGCTIGFHINPIVLYRGWREEYASLVGNLMGLFSPDEIDFLSLGVLWLSPPVVRGIRHRGGESKALQMPLVADTGDRLTYPEKTRIELYSTIYRAMQPWLGKVFVFLCMESTAIWEAVFGEVVPVHEELERRHRRRFPPA